MRMLSLTVLLQAAGLLHLGLLAAGVTMIKVVHFREQTSGLPPFLRQLFMVYMTFIGLVLAGLGTLTFVFAENFARGEPLARALATFCVVFWVTRLMVAAFVFDVRPYLTSGWHRLGHWATHIVFVYFVVLYGFIVLRAGV